LAAAFAFSAWGVTHGACADPSGLRAGLADRIAACPQDGCVIQLQPGEKYVETKPWNLRGRKHLSILGHGEIVYFDFPKDSPPTLAIDATGAVGLHFEGWKMATANSSGKPEVGLLLARNPDNKGAGEHRFDRWQIQGWYRKAAVVSIASETNVWLQCWISNSHPDAIVFWTGRENELDVKSPFGEFGVGSTNTCHDFLATGFGHYGMAFADSPAGVAVAIASGTHDLHIRGGTMSMRERKTPGVAGGNAAVRIGTPGKQPAINILLDAVEWETVGAKHAIRITGRVDGPSVRDSLFQSVDEAIYVERGGAMFDSTFESNRILVRSGIAGGDASTYDTVAVVLGTAVECRFNFRAATLAPLSRDTSVRATRALVVGPDAVFRDNEIHVRKEEEVVASKTVLDKNVDFSRFSAREGSATSATAGWLAFSGNFGHCGQVVFNS
jgi:hypothetical protein